MNEYRLNEYLPIVKGKEGYLFGTRGFFSLERGSLYQFAASQEDVINKLSEGACISETDLVNIFGRETFDKFVKSKVFINYELDTKSIYSRSKAYYFLNNLGDTQDVFSKKNVLILGCGGIGSHVAWNLSVMGVGHIDLVDFDIVDESNLNRQLLYDLGDIGKLKVEVLKDKLNKINPLIHVIAYAKKIWSEEELEEICTSTHYDLIIKAVDSPAKFPLWLDNVCKRNKIKYIAGITVGACPMIGPTYIPDVSCGYSDFFSDEEEFQRVSGISQSLGIIFYYLSSQISSEAFKILSGRGVPTYLNRIYVEDVINNTKLVLTPKIPTTENVEQDRIKHNVTFVTIIFAFMLISNITSMNIFRMIGYIFCLLAPLFVYATREKVMKSAFVNFIIFYCTNLIMIFSDFIKNYHNSFSELVTVFSTIFIGLSITVVLSCALLEILFNVKKVIMKRIILRSKLQ